MLTIPPFLCPSPPQSDGCEKFYYMNLDGGCALCQDGTKCDSVGNELGSLWIKTGHFRTVPSSSEVYQCLNNEACSGGNMTGSGLCSEGYEEVLCSSCQIGYFKDASSGGTCMSCEGSRGSWMTVAFMAGVFLVGGGGISAWFLQPDWLFDPETGYIEKLAKTNVVRFVVVTSQIVTSLENVHFMAGGTSYPYPFEQISTFLGSALSLGVFDLLPIDCWWRTDFFTKLIMTTAVPIALVVLTVLANLIYAALNGTGFTLKGVGTRYAFMYLFYFLPGIIYTPHSCTATAPAK